MKDIKNIKEVASALIIAVVPIVVFSIASKIIGSEQSALEKSIVNVIAYLLCFIFIYLFNKFIVRIKQFRTFKKYEGRWIEIIPNFSRNISICKLEYKNGKYHFSGDSYGESINRSIHFESREFIEGSNNSFFYISKSNLVPSPEAFGKVFDFSNSDEGFYKASGYFVDVSSEENPTLHKTIMIKFDSDFYDYHLNLSRNKNPEVFSSREVYENVKEYVETHYDMENALWLQIPKKKS